MESVGSDGIRSVGDSGSAKHSTLAQPGTWGRCKPNEETAPRIYCSKR